ncbi:hypothetical protein [Marinibacterium profundimaris]|uniref:hypothetical protein n=1 Tax=Marinibacterium profundimaris TaxID=1679460 RepID=UPI0018E942EE|nr:hypothetical protein [Marinibacterium profundimaris]
MVVDVVELTPDETVRLDPSRLGDLYLQLGEAGAEDVVCRAIEELAVRLSHCERLWRRDDLDGLRKCARSLIAIAEQVGMNSLARVAGDVTQAIDACDGVATSATLTRLIRIGARSLTAVWDLQDLSV